MTRAWMILTPLLLAGCAAHHATQPAEEPLRVGGSSSSMSFRGAGALAAAPKPDANGARRTLPIVVSVDIYHLTVPAGAVSRNDEFWKRVDEDRVDVGTHDLLLKNGIRIGVGHDNDWAYFKGLLGKYPSARSSRGRTQAGKEGYVEIPMRSAVPEQVIFGIDDAGHDWGRRFEKCDDVLGVSFIASTHNPGETIVNVCPIVRGLRRYFQTSIYNDETQIELTQPEHLYDMRIQARLPLSDFLIVAPSAQALHANNLGNVFLTSDGAAEPLEHFLLLVPRAYRTDEVIEQKSR